MNKVPPNTMNIRPFVYLRMPDVAIGGTWEKATDLHTWGGYLFPETAIHLKCAKQDGKIEIQESRNPDSLMTHIFNVGAYVVIHNNSLIFFEHSLKKSVPKRLEEV